MSISYYQGRPMINRCKYLTGSYCRRKQISCPYMADPHACSIYDEPFETPYHTPSSPRLQKTKNQKKGGTMNRCLADVFAYCTGQPDAHVETSVITYLDLGSQQRTQETLVTMCRQDPKTCPSHLAQAKLHELTLRQHPSRIPESLKSK